jgi:hypothetical protein
MKTVSGVLHMTKKEESNIRELLEHARADIAYEGDGTYWSGEDDDQNHLPDLKAMKRCQEAIEDIEFIIRTSVVK